MCWQIPAAMGCGALAAPSLSLSSILSEAAICEGLSTASHAGCLASAAGCTSAAAPCRASVSKPEQHLPTNFGSCACDVPRMLGIAAPMTGKVQHLYWLAWSLFNRILTILKPCSLQQSCPGSHLLVLTDMVVCTCHGCIKVWRGVSAYRWCYRCFTGWVLSEALQPGFALRLCSCLCWQWGGC